MKFHFYTKNTRKEVVHHQLLEDIEQTKFALERAYVGLDSVLEPELIDAYIFELNAVHIRYQFLIKEAVSHNLLPLPYLDQESTISALQI
ncbi:MAG: DUF2508 family protein [Eubacteriales bacterium]